MVAEIESNSNPALVVENLEDRIVLALTERRIEDADRYIAQLNGFVSQYIPESVALKPVAVKRIPDPQPNLERFVIFILTFIAGCELGIVIRPILMRWLN